MQSLTTLSATVGNVKAPRPGLWDMLGRAKWLVESALEGLSANVLVCAQGCMGKTQGCDAS